MERPDGAEWHIYHTDDGIVALTSKGRESLDLDTWRNLREYRKKVMGQTALDGDPQVRRYFVSGGNSDVYHLNDRLVVKEAKPTGSVFYSMERMDTIYDIISTSMPRWIDMPAHYGFLQSRHLNHQYLLMERVDSGLTVQDVIDPEIPNNRQRDAITREFGMVTPEDQIEVKRRFEVAKEILTTAVEAAGYQPDDLLTDLHEGNMLVERLRTPVAGSNFKMWVIDQ